jgi:uncharacterized lipoprotein
MMKLRMLALLGVATVLGMAGCGKKTQCKRVERHTKVERHAKHVKKDHRAKGAKMKKRAQKRDARSEYRREERNLFAK